ncbi:hypothetical protein HYU11_01485 [Candidatus Woesearchaeota archaeon]|nr:hypothetical protein [Candidatus Woesearchaeota archaeon]
MERTLQTLGIIKYHHDRGDNPVVVVSAVGVPKGSDKPKTTDKLLRVVSLLYDLHQYDRALDLVREVKSPYLEQGISFGCTDDDFIALGRLEHVCSTRGSADFSSGLKSNFFESNIPEGMLRSALLDEFVKGGEIGTSMLITRGLESMGIPSVAVYSPDAGFISDSQFTNASLLKSSLDSEIAREFIRLSGRNKGSVLVYQGFIAKDMHGNSTTLGRDGSTATALAIGSAINARSIIIYSDDQVLPIDPKIIPNNTPIDQLCYSEMAALAYNGLKVFPLSMLSVLVQKQRLPPIYMRSVERPDDVGTLIKNNAKYSGVARAMAVRRNIGYREFFIDNEGQKERLISTINEYDGVSILKHVDEVDPRGRKLYFVYQFDPRFIDVLREDPERMQNISDKVSTSDPEFPSDLGRYFKETLFLHLKQAYGSSFRDGVIQLHNASILTIVGSDLGKSYDAISRVMAIIGRVQPHQKLQHTVHRFPIVREADYIQLVIPRGLENVAAEIYNELYRA